MINWTDYNIYHDVHLPTDWVPVTAIDTSGGYDWKTFRAFWSPSARRYFWHGDTGCSCDSWGDSLRTEADFGNGDLAAIRAFAEWACLSATVALDAVAEVQRFREAGSWTEGVDA